MIAGLAADEAERARAAKESGAPHDTAQGRAQNRAEGGAFRMTCSEPERESEKVSKLYEALVSAKQSAGEDLGQLTPESFAEFVRKKTKHLQKEKNCT